MGMHDAWHVGDMDAFTTTLTERAGFKKKTGGPVATIGAIKIFVDEDLPPDVAEFRDPDGKVLSRITGLSTD